MHQLSELDASFLYLETDRTPMHFGGIYVFDSASRDEPLKFDEFYQYIQSRLHIAKFFRQRLVEVPFRLDHPYWADDPAFDLNQHVRHISLEAPGDPRKLNALAESIFAAPLRRDRPLWEICFVDHVQLPESKHFGFAMIVKIHHAAIDAVTGEEVMGSLLDFSDSSKDNSSPPQWRPKALPSTFSMIGRLYGNALQTPFRLATLAKDTAADAFYTLLLQRLKKLNLPPVLFSAPRSDINQNVGKAKTIGFSEFSLESIRALKQQLGQVTINDVVLGICAEALRSYLQEQDRLPTESLTCMSPISVRSKRLDSPTGNQLSAMLVSLATDIENPVERVLEISRNARISETYRHAISAQRLTRLVPSTMAALSARIYTEFQLAQRHKPIFNVPITNIPGPQMPLFLNGARLIRQIGIAPPFDGMGLVIVVNSYDGTQTFAFTACARLLPSGEVFSNHLKAAFEKLDTEAARFDYAAWQQKQDDQTSPNASTIGAGIIEDVTGLLGSLFSFSSKK